MVVKKFNSGSSEDTLPWVNEFVNQSGQRDLSVLVRKMVKGQKGIIVITSVFKGFLFKNSAIYGFITEALDKWITREQTAFPLYAVLEDGILTLGIDPDDKPCQWIVDGNNYQQKLGKPDMVGTNPAMNPFLFPSPPTSKKSVKKETEDSYLDQMTH
jgi:hypothetical protein